MTLEKNETPETSNSTIYSYFFHKRKAVIKKYLAGKISFENLPSQIKILEGEYQKNSRLQSQQQVNALRKAAGVDREAIFRYFRSREKMDKDMKAAKSDKAPSNYRYAPKPVSATERAATQPLSHEFRQDTEQEIDDLAPPVPGTEVVHSQQCHGSQNPEDLVDAPTRDDQARTTLSKDVIDEYLIAKTINTWRENKNKILEQFKKEQFVDFRRAEQLAAYFGKPPKKIIGMFSRRRRTVMKRYLAGKISFEELPCQMKILEGEYQTNSQLQSQKQVNDMCKAAGVQRDASRNEKYEKMKTRKPVDTSKSAQIYRYLKRRRRMEEKRKAAKLRKPEIVESPVPKDPVLPTPKAVIDEYLASKILFESNFKTNNKKILKFFYEKRKAVMEAHLAGVILFENLPCEIKILETEFQKCSNLTTHDQIVRCQETGMQENAIFEYFNMRRKMNEKMKTEKSGDTSEAPELENPTHPAPSTRPAVFIVAHKEPNPPVPSTEAGQSPLLPNGSDNQQELEDPVPVTEMVYYQQTQGDQNPEELVEDEQYEIQEEDESIPSYGALPDWDFVFAHLRQKAKNQAPISLPVQPTRLATESSEDHSPERQVDELTPEQADQELAYHDYVAQEQSTEASVDFPGSAPKQLLPSMSSKEMDYPTSSMAPAPSNSVNRILESDNQVEGLSESKGVDEKVIRFFEYFHTRRKMMQKVKEAKSGDTPEEPSEALKSPELKDSVQPVSTQEDQAPSTCLDVVTQLEIKNPASPGPDTQTEATQPPLHEFRRDIKQEIGDLAPSVPVTEVVHSQQCHGSQSTKGLVDDERYEMEEGKTILSHGALLDSDFRSSQNLKNLLEQTQELLATCHANFAQKHSEKAPVECPRLASGQLLPSILPGEMDYPTSSMAPATSNSVPAQSHQAELSQQDARSHERLLADLSRQMTAIQETLGAYLAATPRTQIPTKRKRLPSLEVFTNEPLVSSPAVKRASHQEAVSFDGVGVQRAPGALRKINEIAAPTPEREAQPRQERMNMYDGWFKNTYLPFNHSINYESWTRQQFEEFAVQFLPLDVVTVLVKKKVDGSKMDRIRCGNEQLMGRLHVGSNGKFALEHWNLIRKNINSIHSYRTRKEEEGVE
ncbi:hypothetical protein B9Z55_012526 [Caenorhabditis nigoni]|uniref:Homeobox domain-containing protein n=1 Tax=Caenorhabditis nigoni TaxID=1611254 RepID=A0A2G5TY66_9PELO|nr:hypothetical protein B9Z55_012526 [Caenorhabditis nigoni]